MFKFWSLFVGLAISLVAQAQLDPTTYPDVLKIDPPVISIRNMLTGEPLRHQQYQDRAMNTHWQLIDIKAPEFAARRDNGTFVQFRVFGTRDRCYSFQGVTNCSNLKNTVFTLIPMDTGAIAIKDVAFGYCLGSPHYREYQLKPCGRSLQGRELDSARLWTFTPPFGRTTLIQTKP